MFDQKNYLSRKSFVKEKHCCDYRSWGRVEELCNTHTRSHMHARTHAHARMHAHTHTHTHARTHTHTHIHAHTHAHTHPPSFLI